MTIPSFIEKICSVESTLFWIKIELRMSHHHGHRHTWTCCGHNFLKSLKTTLCLFACCLARCFWELVWNFQQNTTVYPVNDCLNDSYNNWRSYLVYGVNWSTSGNQEVYLYYLRHWSSFVFFNPNNSNRKNMHVRSSFTVPDKESHFNEPDASWGVDELR